MVTVLLREHRTLRKNTGIDTIIFYLHGKVRADSYALWNGGSGTMMGADDILSDDTEESSTKFQLSRLLLTKKVAEAFMFKSDMNTVDDDDDVTPSATDTTGSTSWGASILQSSQKALNVDDTNENNSGNASRQSEYSIETDLQADRDNLLEEDNASGLAQRLETDLAGSIVELWQQRLTQSSSYEGDIDIEYGSDVNSTGPPSPRGDESFAASNMNAQMDGNGNRSTNLTAPTRLPLNMPNDSTSGTALEEIRARLRKTQFDYSSDSGQKVTEATPQIDYRNVLKKKDQM